MKRKFLLCYDIINGPFLAKGYWCQELEALTQDALNGLSDTLAEDFSKKSGEKGLTGQNIVWRSITPLEG